jgi:hypothetical protein
MRPPDTDDPTEVAKSLAANVTPWLLRSTVGLYTQDWLGFPRVVGSAVCMESKSGPALITAGHVLTTKLKRGLYLLPGSSQGSLISLHGCRSASLHEDGRQLDLAVILLKPEIVERMHTKTYWLTHEDILDSEESLESERLVIFGYPVERFAWNPARHELQTRSLLYLTALYDGERGSWEEDDSFTSKYAFDLDFAPGNSVGADGNRSEHPTPQGLSGGGIWAFVGPRERRPPIALAGIQHRWHRELHALRGTRIVGLTEEIEPA